MDYEALIRVLCTDLIEDTDSLIIREIPSNDESKKRLFLVMANDHDVARLIGKGGKIIRSIREIVNLAAKMNKDFIDIQVDNFN